MQINVILLATVLVLTPSCLGAPGVGDFFEKLFGVFKPEGIVVTDAPDNATDSNTELVTETVITELDNETEVINAKLTSIVEESLVESEDVTTTELATDADTTISTSPATTTTVLYKLFHPNTTTTTTAATTVTTSSTEAATNVTTPLSDATSNLTTSVPESTSNGSTVPSTTAPTLSSSTIVNDVLCKTTFDAAANLKITSCADSSTPKAISKRTAIDYLVESQDESTPVPTTTQLNVSTASESIEEIEEEDESDDADDSDDDDNDEYETLPISTGI